MNLQRIRAEVRREGLCPSSLWLVAGVLAFSLLAALFAVMQASLKLYTPAVYLFVPLVMVPVGAHRVACDRDRDAAALNATTPIRASEVLAGKVIALVLLWGVTVAATVPLLYVLTMQAASNAFLQLTPLVAWGLVLGLVSALAGLIVGYAQGPGATRAVSLGFGLVVLWLVVALQRERLYALASTETEVAIVRAIAHASPSTWAIEALTPNAAYLVPGHGELLTGLALLLAPLAVGLTCLAVGLQHLDGWHPNPLTHRRALGGLAIALVGIAALLGAWSYPDPPGSTSPVSPEPAKANLDDVQVRLAVEDEATWSEHTTARVHLSFAGSPNATLGIERFHLEAEHLTLAPRSSIPDTVRLDGQGRGHLSVPVTLTPHQMVGDITLTARLAVDGQGATMHTPLSPSGYAVPLAASAATGATAFGLAAAAAFHVPRRMNRW